MYICIYYIYIVYTVYYMSIYSYSDVAIPFKLVVYHSTQYTYKKYIIMDGELN